MPPLPAEDHVCTTCGVDYAALTVTDAVAAVAAVPGRARAAAQGVSPTGLRRRPEPATWSVVEYVCHLRDVYVSSTIRVHRTRTEDSPVFEPMLNDLRARIRGALLADHTRLHLDADLRPVKPGGEYLDPEAAAAAIEAVRNQGKR